MEGSNVIPAGCEPNDLAAFRLADALVLDLYREVHGFPDNERFGLQVQLCRAALAITAHLVEACGRRRDRDFVHFVAKAIGSAFEVQYLVRLSVVLGFVEAGAGAELADGYQQVARALQALVTAVTDARVARCSGTWIANSNGALAQHAPDGVG